MCADCEELERRLSTVLELHAIYEDAVDALHTARRELSGAADIASAVGAAHIVLESIWIPTSQVLSLCGERYRRAVLGIDMLRSAVTGGTDGMVLAAIVSQSGGGATLDIASLRAFIARYARDRRTFRQLHQDISRRIEEFRSSLADIERARTALRATMVAGGCDVGFRTDGP